MRHILSLTALSALLLLAVPNLPLAQPAPEVVTKTGIFTLVPDNSVTQHVLKTRTRALAYTATAGTEPLYGPDGNMTARIFYTAYVAKDGGKDRPLTFVFNGGPGAASAYLHLGLVGPRILDFGAAGQDGTTPSLSDNPDSWLDFTDLVMIDPIGTGWSRADDDATAAKFYGVRQDAESLAKFISLYVQHNGRMGARKFLLGESYGGFRAGKVATALKDSQGMLMSGIIMASPLIESELIFGGSIDPLGAALKLPSLAAAELERNKTFTPEAVAQAESFAMRDYLVTLAGPAPKGTEAAEFYRRVAQLTGVDVDLVTRTRGFLGEVYGKNSARAKGGPVDSDTAGAVVSPYDAAESTADAYPQDSDNRNDDAVLDGYTRAYGATFAAYARNELGFACDMTYALLNIEVNRKWEWSDGPRSSRSEADATDDILGLLSTIPSFRLLVVHGYSDVLTPYGASRYVLDHLPPALAKDRVALEVYRGGHMFYTSTPSRIAVTQDARAFYAAGTGTE